MMPKYKYTLIVSQFYHSRHSFIVGCKDNFVEVARQFAKELMQYKRSENHWTKEPYLGDLDDKYAYGSDGSIRYRYNINDAGDIYLINSDSINNLMYEVVYYANESRRQSVGFKRKDVITAINQHHEYDCVKQIVEKHFELM